jgi:hypothetical protein
MLHCTGKRANTLVLLTIIFVLFGQRYALKKKGMSSPSDVVKLLQDTLDTQPTIVGQPNDDNLLALKEKLLSVLQTISYNRANSVHHVVVVNQSDTAYTADHNGVAFPIPIYLGLWEDKIAKDAMVVELKKVKAIHKACAEDYGSWKAAKDGCKSERESSNLSSVAIMVANLFFTTTVATLTVANKNFTKTVA